MASVAAISGRELRKWLQTEEGVMTHKLVPSALLNLQTCLASFIHLLELSALMGVTVRPLVRDWVAHFMEDTMMLSGSILAGDLDFLSTDRVSQNDENGYALQLVQLKSELHMFTSDLAGWITAIQRNHQYEARNLISNITVNLDVATDGTYADEFSNELLERMREVLPAVAALVAAGLPVQWED